MSGHSAYSLIPGLILQGLALGILLTVNDPVGMNAADEEDQGEAAGMIKTAEQLGGAQGVAILGAVQLTTYFGFLDGKLADKNIVPSADDVAQAKAVHRGSGGTRHPQRPTTQRADRLVYQDFVDAHGQSFRVAFLASAIIALLGAVACWFAGPQGARDDRAGVRPPQPLGHGHGRRYDTRADRLPPAAMEPDPPSD